MLESYWPYQCSGKHIRWTRLNTDGRTQGPLGLRCWFNSIKNFIIRADQCWSLTSLTAKASTRKFHEALPNIYIKKGGYMPQYWCTNGFGLLKVLCWYGVTKRYIEVRHNCTFIKLHWKDCHSSRLRSSNGCYSLTVLTLT